MQNKLQLRRTRASPGRYLVLLNVEPQSPKMSGISRIGSVFVGLKVNLATFVYFKGYLNVGNLCLTEIQICLIQRVRQYVASKPKTKTLLQLVDRQEIIFFTQCIFNCPHATHAIAGAEQEAHLFRWVYSFGNSSLWSEYQLGRLQIRFLSVPLNYFWI